MSRYQLTADADRDLIEIEDYVAEDDPLVANRVIEEFRAAMQTLANMPGIGHRRADINDARYRYLRGIFVAYCLYS